MNGTEWTTLRDPVRTDDGHLVPGFRARLVEGVDKETIREDVVLIHRYMHDTDGGQTFYVPTVLVAEMADQLYELEYGGTGPRAEGVGDRWAKEC